MSGKFTPGPWDVKATDTLYQVVSTDGIYIVSTSWHGRFRGPYPLKDEACANARLIASAPAMHAALEKAEAALRAVDTAPIEYADAVFWPQVSEARTAIEAALALSHPLEEKS